MLQDVERPRQHSLRGLAQVHAARGEEDKAAAFAREALDIAEETPGSEHRELPPFLNSSGLVLRSRDPDAARGHLARALELSRRTKGDRHPATALSLQRLGQLEIDRGELVSAEEHLVEARTIREALNPTAPELSDVQFELGRLELARGRPMAAVPWLESAVQLRLQPGVPAYHLGDVVTLMSYRDTYASIRSKSLNEVNYAQSSGGTIVAGIETSCGVDDTAASPAPRPSRTALVLRARS